MFLLLPRFCFFTSNNDDKHLAPPEIYLPPGCVVLATALLAA